MCRVLSLFYFLPAPSLTEKNLPIQKIVRQASIPYCAGRSIANSPTPSGVFVVTGGYSGCGLELRKFLYQHNGTVYVAGRSKVKADTAIQ